MKNNTIQEQNWALITKQGEIAETFHSFDTLSYWKGKLEKEYMDELKIKWIGGKYGK